MNLRVLLVTPLALPLLVVVRPAADEITSRPVEGLTLVKTIRVEVEGEMSFDEGSLTSRFTHEQLLVVTDEVQAAKDGRATKLRRTYP